MIMDYKETFAVPSYAVGADNCLRLSALLQLQQEAGEQHMTRNGLSFATLQDKGVAFVVTRLSVHITRLPQMGETVTLTTWHRNIRGVQFFRCYTLTDQNGAPLTDAVTAFALVDTKNHRLLRPDALGELCFPDQSARNVNCPDPVKELPPAMVEVAAVHPRYSELDPNGHVNNTRYADFLCDNIPSGMAGKSPKELLIRFERETLPQDLLRITAAEQRVDNGGIAWVCGSHTRGDAFAAKLCYEDTYERRF